MKYWLRILIRKWLDKMEYRIKHDIDEPMPKEELDKLIENDIWKKK